MKVLNGSVSSEWIERNFGSVSLGDERRNTRALSMAHDMISQPSASLPQQMKSAAALQGAYGLLHQEAVSYEALIDTHWQLTRELARQEPVVLFAQDTTHIDYTHHPTAKGLGPIGDGRAHGYLLHTVVTLIPQPRRVLGLAAQEPFIRQARPKGESRAERLQRPRESDVWARAVLAVGSPPAGSRWVHVGDRGSDIYLFLEQCRATNVDFLIRAAQNRCVERTDGQADHLFDVARTLPSQGETTLAVPASDKDPAREARIRISYGPVKLQPAYWVVDKPSLEVWVVRAWEAEPAAEVQNPLEWVLLTSVPTETVVEAWERVDWYKTRWVVEDYHQCLKTGCAIEKRQLRDYEDLKRLLGFLAPIAAFLLQLRDIARLSPDTIALTELPSDLVTLVAYLAGIQAETLTLAQFWRAVAQQGGYLGRRRDGPPGWKTVWRGWQHVHTLLKGVQLASQLPP